MNLEEIKNLIIHEVSNYLPKLIGALACLIIGLWVIKKLSSILKIAFQKRDLDISLQTFLGSLVSIGLKIILIISVAGMLGFQSTSLVAILGAAGLAVGLALQGSLANFAGGVLILIFKPFKVGDLINAQGFIGVVKEIQIFNTIIDTPDNKRVIIPNGTLSNGAITNISKNNLIRVELSIKVGIENDFLKIQKELIEKVNSYPKVLKNPQVYVGIGSFVEGGYEIHVRPFSNAADYWDVYYEVNLILLNYINENHIYGPKIQRSINQN